MVDGPRIGEVLAYEGTNVLIVSTFEVAGCRAMAAVLLGVGSKERIEWLDWETKEPVRLLLIEEGDE
ncbi:hypothetical protein HY504_01340 [Candidatus Wolfebacteria bacterium]|nr:hypothetical protein [Candidatus Wolfebacteria bacterium]